MQGTVRIGTSGWMYKDWGAAFYPQDMKSGFLSFLAAEFDTVEVNSSFYHLPLASTFVKWREETPHRFIFSVKLSRYITHQLRLRDATEPVCEFLVRARGLGTKLGPILIQLPPSLRFDEELLSSFLASLREAKRASSVRARFALEPRHPSWLEAGERVRMLLRKERIALVFPHSAKIPSFDPTDENVLTDFVYVRFHGPSEFAASRYGEERLEPWAARLRAWRARGIRVYAYFNNDIHGHAIFDARTLKQLVATAEPEALPRASQAQETS